MHRFSSKLPVTLSDFNKAWNSEKKYPK